MVNTDKRKLAEGNTLGQSDRISRLLELYSMKSLKTTAETGKLILALYKARYSLTKTMDKQTVYRHVQIKNQEVDVKETEMTESIQRIKDILEKELNTIAY